MEKISVIKLPWGIPLLLFFLVFILGGGGESEASILYVTPIDPPSRTEIPIQVPQGTFGEAKGIYQEGLSLYNTGNYSEAASRWNRILEKEPNSKGGEAAAYLVGEAHYIGAASRLADIRTFASRDRADRMKKSGKPDWEPALNTFQRATRDYPGSPWFPLALYRMGESYRQMGFLVEARGSLLRIVREFPNSPYSPKALIAVAGIAFHEGKFKEAEGFFQTAFQRYPEAPEVPAAVFGAADARFFQREFGEAQRSYKSGLERWPAYLKTHPDTLFRYGETVFQNGEWVLAREAFFSLYNLYPGYDQAGFALNRIGDSYRLEGRIETARKFYEEVLALYAEGELPLQTRITLGTLEEQKALARGDRPVDRETAFEAALAYFQEVSEADLPIAGEAVLRMGRIQEQRGDTEGAILLYQRLLEKPADPGGEGAVTPEYRAEAVRSVSRILKEEIESRLGKGRDEAGVAVYQRHKNLVREHVRDLPLLRAAAEAHYRVGLFLEAIALYRIVLENAGKEGGDDLFAQGESYFAAGDLDGTLRTLESYRSRFPGGEFREKAGYRTVEALYRKGDFTGMTTFVEREGVDSGFPARIALLLSEAYRRGDQPAKAREILTKSLARHSGSSSSEEVASLYAALGDLAAEGGEYDTAEDFYRKGGGTASSEDDRDFFRLMTARAMMKSGRSGKAGEMFAGLAASRSEIVRRAAETWGEEVSPNGGF